MFTAINEYGKGAVVQVATVFGPVYHVASGKVVGKGIFQTFIE